VHIDTVPYNNTVVGCNRKCQY